MLHLSYLKYMNTYNNIKKIKIGTDCSGIEAPLQALKQLGITYQHMFASEIDEKIRNMAIKNYGYPKYLFDDITTRDHSKLPKIDLYVAGFPCQAFSHLGKREGFDDNKNRGLIFFDCYETIKHTDPKMFILENVKGLLTHDKGNTINIIMDYLENLSKYDIYVQVLNTLDYGLPHNRERVYIVGLRKNYFRSYNFPEPIPLEINITHIVSDHLPNTELTPHKKSILKDLLNTGKIDTLNNPWVVNLNCSSYKRSSPMLGISPCLMASGAIYYVTSVNRNLNPDEFLKLQGFDNFIYDDNEYNKVYSAAGNSMSVPVIAFIISSMLDSAK